MDVTKPHSGGITKLRQELREFLALWFYLYICFGSILLYAEALLRAHGFDYEPYGLAAVKSFIFAKFILIENAAFKRSIKILKPLALAVLYKSFVYLVFLVLLSIVEEIVAGLLHGRPALVSLAGIGGGNILQALATCLLLWVILLPITFQLVEGVLGENRLRKILFSVC